jgi:D-aspartate oxidase/D-amino-acid oxidase
MVHDDWHPTPRAEITKDILKRGFALCPELAPPEVRSQRAASLDDVRALIIEECCGLRPARKGGIRLEVDYVESPGRERVPIVFNYG